jgi:hypothetical protein
VKPFYAALACICVIILIGGCSSLPLREGGLAVDKDTIVGIEDLGVASVTKGF